MKPLVRQIVRIDDLERAATPDSGARYTDVPQPVPPSPPYRKEVSGFPVWLVLISILAGLVGCNEQRQSLELGGLTMGTTYSVELHARGVEERQQQFATNIEALLQEINRQMSTYDPHSVLSTYNRSNSTDWVSLPEELFIVIQTALQIAGLSQGALDITIGPLVNLWGFGPGPDTQEIPDENRIQQFLKRTGYQLLELDTGKKRIKKQRPDVYIDLSAIAKGYAVDRIADYLEQQGIEHYLVEIGGEIRTHGVNAANEPWQIGIEKPAIVQSGVQLVLPLSNQGMATSGDYRNFHMIDGVRYSHTINPQTGKPVTHNLAAVTVVHPSAMMADGLATALLVMGPQRGFELAQEEDLAALFITRHDNEFGQQMTPAFTRLLNND